MLERIQIF